MKKNTIFWLLATAVVMLLFPWLAVAFVPSDSGMAVLILLLLMIDPIYSFLIGAAAGKDIKKRWYFPVMSSLLFLAGAWIFLDMGSSDFLVYTAAYLLIGFAAMIISMLIYRKKENTAMEKGEAK